MHQATQQRLLDLNREFYATIADEFDSTRHYIQPGMKQALTFATSPNLTKPLRVLDAGCGNGRFAWALATLAQPITYIGIDANARLLALAQQHIAQFQQIAASFYQADLTTPTWASDLPLATCHFDLIVCFATLQHFPSFDLRQRIVTDFASLLAPQGRLIMSNWQALSSARFVEKQIDWAVLGINAADLELGDILLPWKQGKEALRYIHLVDETELQQLATGAGLRLSHTYRSDGKETNLNLYSVMTR